MNFRSPARCNNDLVFNESWATRDTTNNERCHFDHAQILHRDDTITYRVAQKSKPLYQIISKSY